MIVPFAAGGPADAIARIIGERMKRSLGQPVIIENITAASGSVGVGRVARARPDGYTIDLGATPTLVAASPQCRSWRPVRLTSYSVTWGSCR
jgi:tripartite-type tricarboxylate transporter receptor subunit TctC